MKELITQPGPPETVFAPTTFPESESRETLTDDLMPDVQTIFLGGLFIMALLASCYAASEILMPVVLAFMLKLVLRPMTRTMERFYIPRMLSSFLVIMLLLGSVVGIGTALSVPAAKWAHELPNEYPRIQERLKFINGPITPIKQALQNADELAGPPAPKNAITIALPGSRLSDKLLDGTKNFASSLFETLLLLFFMLVAGDTFLRKLVEVLPRFKDKKQAVNISNQIEKDISAFLITITLMNAAVGLLTMFIMMAFDMPDPVLWGIVAFLLNYIPVVGPIIMLALIIFLGLLSDAALGYALMPAGLYFVVHVLEGEAVTPMVLAKRFTLNPVLVIMGLFFWYWIWGIPGAILSTPMLAITKIICDRVESLKPFGHFIEG